MAFHLVLEALARIEHKLDAILRAARVPSSPMHFVGLPCPVCQRQIDYLINVTHGVVTRKCACSTGKVSTTPLLPITQGPSNAAKPSRNRSPDRSSDAEDSDRSKTS